MSAIKIDGKEYELERVDETIEEWDNDCYSGEIITIKYKCPLCGKGLYIHVDEDIPGDRDHYSYLDCENCDPDREIYDNPFESSWDLVKRTKEQIEELRKFRAKFVMNEWGFMVRKEEIE